MTGFQSMRSEAPDLAATKAERATITRILNIADPTIVPIPILFPGPKESPIDVNSSGAEEPAARNVAPATSGDN